MHLIYSFFICGTILLQIVPTASFEQSTELIKSNESNENIFDTFQKSYHKSSETSVTEDELNPFSTDRSTSDSSESSQSATSQYDSTNKDNAEKTDDSQTTQENFLTEDNNIELSTDLPSLSTMKNFDISTITVKKFNSIVNETFINVINKDDGSDNNFAIRPNSLLLVLLGILILCTVSVISFASYKMCKVRTKSEEDQPMSTQSSVKRKTCRYTMEMDELHRKNIEDLKTRFKSQNDRPT